MAEVVWKDLAKAVADLTKISEEINNKILVHNQDPSAHKQAGEALDVHRTAINLDHLLECSQFFAELYYVRSESGFVESDSVVAWIDVDKPCNILCIVRCVVYNDTVGYGGIVYLFDSAKPPGANVIWREDTGLNFGSDRMSSVENMGVTKEMSGIITVDKPGLYDFKFWWGRIGGGTVYLNTSTIILIPLGAGIVEP